MPNFIVLASPEPEPDQRTVIAQGLKNARLLEDSLLLLRLAIAEFEQLDDQSKQYRTVAALLDALASQLDCFGEENRVGWERLEKS